MSQDTSAQLSSGPSFLDLGLEIKAEQVQDPQNKCTTSQEHYLPLSKNQQKKLKRKQQWEEGRDERKKRRREKLKAQKARKREAIAADPSLAPSKPTHQSITVPVTFVVDCSFDDMMNENEIISLGTQLTRSYADVKKARYRANLCISSFGGRLKDRFEGLMESTHLGWKGVRFREEGIVDVCEEAKEWMAKQASVKDYGALRSPEQSAGQRTSQDGPGVGEIVYLSSDSPNTLDRLKPFSTYIIGGLVDKNRHKGICYKRAEDASIKTAKLPIGDYIKMSSRQVLATCHVSEIMLKWIELGDWGEAFTSVIPKRKGGVLRDSEDGSALSPTSPNEAVCDGDKDHVDELNELPLAVSGNPDSDDELNFREESDTVQA